MLELVLIVMVKTKVSHDTGCNRLGLCHLKNIKQEVCIHSRH